MSSFSTARFSVPHRFDFLSFTARRFLASVEGAVCMPGFCMKYWLYKSTWLMMDSFSSKILFSSTSSAYKSSIGSSLRSESSYLELEDMDSSRSTRTGVEKLGASYILSSSCSSTFFELVFKCPFGLVSLGFTRFSSPHQFWFLSEKLGAGLFRGDR